MLGHIPMDDGPRANVQNHQDVITTEAFTPGCATVGICLPGAVSPTRRSTTKGIAQVMRLKMTVDEGLPMIRQLARVHAQAQATTPGA
jgi:hypothetical protein